MKIDITKQEQETILQGLKTLQASTNRTINTEKNQTVKEIRHQELNTIAALSSKITNMTEALK